MKFINNKISLIIFCCLICLISGMSIYKINNKKGFSNIKIVEIKGNVTIENLDGDITKADKNMYVYVGDTLNVENEGVARLKIAPNKYIKLRENTKMTVNKMIDNNTRAEFTLFKGSIESESGEDIDNNSLYKIMSVDSSIISEDGIKIE